MKQNDYFRGHLITTDGKWYIAHHGGVTLRALTRKGIELLITGVSHETSFFDLADYHIGRAIDLITAELGNNPSGDEENALLIQLKRTHALLIQTQWKQLK